MRFLLKAFAVLFILFFPVFAFVFYLHPLWVVDQQTHYRLWNSGVQSNYVVVDGYRLHYFEATPPHNAPGQPLLLIHGLGDHGESWAPLIPTLAAHGFHVYAPDLLGYGRSAMPPDADYSIPNEEKIVSNFLAVLNIPKADVAGWSMGGWIAMRLAVDHPALVDRLILYDSAGIYFPAHFPTDIFTPTDPAGLARLLAILSPHPRPMPGFVARDALRKLHHYAVPVTRSMASMMDGRSFMDFRLVEIHQPTLIVWGSHDDLLPLATGERIHHGIPQSTLAIIDTCGHLAPAECHQPVLQATLAFLTANPPESGGERHYSPSLGLRDAQAYRRSKPTACTDLPSSDRLRPAPADVEAWSPVQSRMPIQACRHRATVAH